MAAAWCISGTHSRSVAISRDGVGGNKMPNSSKITIISVVGSPLRRGLPVVNTITHVHTRVRP